MKKIFESKGFKIVLYALGAVILLALVFRAGMEVGSRKANFAYRWGEQYHRNFGGPRGGFIPEAGRTFLPNPHGTFGKIISVNLPEFTVLSPEGVEKVVRVGTSTAVVKDFREKGSTTDLAVDAYVVVVGEPNDAAQIEAKLIRVVPPPQNIPSSTAPGFPKR